MTIDVLAEHSYKKGLEDARAATKAFWDRYPVVASSEDPDLLSYDFRENPEDYAEFLAQIYLIELWANDIGIRSIEYNVGGTWRLWRGVKTAEPAPSLSTLPSVPPEKPCPVACGA
jgi:hypothetical protein